MRMRFFLEVIRGVVTVACLSIVMGIVFGVVISGLVRVLFKMDELDVLLFVGLPVSICVSMFYCWKLWPTQGVKINQES
ncbi:hypothetical protein ACFOLJ_06420 [Rugamonas sp. CCM 8940]|uniref:hypothetical protein n=1 Tax=Rugamonas sp. CCM 8940 TaxID=2765359 RepID=UPI0018F7730E|nr:hypothetical protein [Rugamonas sp. CCM 8940]MBJ7310411.1 hypothetical protein [Rugamonas sp. CCM 8940]